MFYFFSVGGAPELCKEFRFIVSEARKLDRLVIDRCNLTALLEPGRILGAWYKRAIEKCRKPFLSEIGKSEMERVIILKPVD